VVHVLVIVFKIVPNVCSEIVNEFNPNVSVHNCIFCTAVRKSVKKLGHKNFEPVTCEHNV
jgi:hypothetical protein